MTQNIIKYQYTFSAIPNKIQKEFVIIKFNVNEYLKEIDKYKKDRPLNQFYYDYDKELDFSIDTKDPNPVAVEVFLITDDDDILLM